MKRFLSFIFIIVCFLFFAPKAHAAIALVQATSTNGGSGTSVSKDLASNTTAGDLIVVVWRQGDPSSTLQVGDSQNNTYNLAVRSNQTGGASFVGADAIYYAMNIAGGPDTINVTSSISNTERLAYAEYSGVATTNALDQVASSTNAGSTAVASGAVTPSQNGELIIGALTDSSGATWTPNPLFTSEAQVPSGAASKLLFEDLVQNTAAPINATATLSASIAWAADIATFKPFSNVISPVLGLAWGDKMSWINFLATSSNFQVTNSNITGYAWSQNFGWINLSPSGSGVLNDGLGNLSGYAWGQNVGWINFLGVTISSTGTFQGIASGTIAGNLTFNCSACLVNTSWRPATTSPVSVVNTTLNGASNIILIPSSTVNVNVGTTITDTNGCSAITGGTTTILLYRSGVTSSSCLAGSGNGSSPNLNCYLATAFTASSTCSANTVNATTTFAVQYFAQATDASSSFASENWLATVDFKDSSNATGTQDSIGQELLTMDALNITTSSINYGTVNPGNNTLSTNQVTTVQDVGNTSSTLQVFGTALTLGANTIVTSSQHYATGTFTFGGNEQLLSGNAATVSGFFLTSPTSTNAVSSPIFWGVSIPSNLPTGTYSGTVTFISLFAP